MTDTDIPEMLRSFTTEEITKAADEIRYCSVNRDQCFYNELCPISNSTACCYHCSLSTHLDASTEERAYIKKEFLCKTPRCFRAVAGLFLGKEIKNKDIEELPIK